MAHETRQRWNAEKYDRDTGFVSALGRGLLPLLDPKPGERILDLGCGTGDLTNEIAQAGAWVAGLDASAEMLRRAEEKYPHLTWILGRAETFRSDAAFDAVFSNAALHWMKQASQVTETVWLALRPGGRFVAEFGGQGNVRAIRDAIYQTLARRGVDAAVRDPWYFPSIGEYAGLLEQVGFQVRYAEHFQRITPLIGGQDGLRHWLDVFAAESFFFDFSQNERLAMYAEMEQMLEPILYRNGAWVADYWRIRIVAVKPGKV